MEFVNKNKIKAMKTTIKQCFVLLLVGTAFALFAQQKAKNPYYSRTATNKIKVSNTVWKKILSPDLYAVAREGATEKAFTGKYNTFNQRGTYYCAVCGNRLFRSDSKFESSCGWPSFFEPGAKGSVVYKEDLSYNMVRTEVLCGRCGSHLGHVFDDGPKPTGKRYCMNSISLDFEADQTNPFKKN